MAAKHNKVVAIDGPAGSGKSTVAKRVAERLGILYVDSGALYRAVTWFCLKRAIDFSGSNGAVAAALQELDIELKASVDGVHVFINGEDVTAEIRSTEVTALVSTVSEKACVREIVNRYLHELAKDKDVILDGRDIGTVVFPDAELKIFLNASLEERARRRFSELKSQKKDIDFNEIRSDISRRDKHDSERALAPLRPAADAVLLDTTNLTIDEGVAFVVDKFHELESHA